MKAEGQDQHENYISQQVECIGQYSIDITIKHTCVRMPYRSPYSLHLVLRVQTSEIDQQITLYCSEITAAINGFQ